LAQVRFRDMGCCASKKATDVASGEKPVKKPEFHLEVNAAVLGENAEVSPDGMVVRYKTLSGGACAVSAKEIPQQKDKSRYFEVEVMEHVENFPHPNGMLVGVTLTPPSKILAEGQNRSDMPSELNDITNSWGVKVGSCWLDPTYSEGGMTVYPLANFATTKLKTGDKVGILAAANGNLEVTVNGKQEVCCQMARIPLDQPLYACVQPHMNTLAVRLVAQGS